jgi:hypothetical protein
MELETLLIVVVSISSSNEEVEYDCDVDGNVEDSTDFDIYSLVVNRVGLIVPAI